MGDYQVDIGGWIKTGWENFLANWQDLTGYIAIYAVVMFVLTVPLSFASGALTLYLIPQLGVAAQGVATVLITIPIWLLVIPISAYLAGGLIRGGLAVARGGRMGIGEMFSAGKDSFMPMLVMMAIMCVIQAVPMFIDMGIRLLCHFSLDTNIGNVVIMGWAIVQLIISLVMAVFFFTWSFTSFFIIEEGLGAVAAIKKSMSVYMKQFWMNSLYLLLVTLIACAGMMACCVGLFFTGPLSLVLLSVMYVSVTDQLKPGGQVATAE